MKTTIAFMIRVLSLTRVSIGLFFGFMAGSAFADPPPPDQVAAPGHPGWTVDAGSGCWIWNSQPQFGETASWTGPCPDGPITGQGVLEFNSAFGKDHYEGAAKDGRMHGHGVYTNAELRYEGDFVSGKRQGHGIQTWTTGGKYDGMWANNQQNGQGRMSLGDWSYTGGWKDGEFSGEGTQQDDQSKYVGHWEHGKQNGKGIETYRTGDRYEGDWVDAKKEGHGTKYFGNGDRYIGEWFDNVPDGQGEAIFKNGKRYSGDWDEGCLNIGGSFIAIFRDASECD